MLAILLLLLAFAAAAHLPTTLANHHVCSWTGPGNDPEASGYTLFCDAKKEDDKGATAAYYCHIDGFKPNLVADYGILKPNTLEFATACNGGGFVRGRYGACCCSHWGICIGDRDAKTKNYPQCYYQSAWDDCEWPQTFDDNKKPNELHIWMLHNAMEESGMLNVTLGRK